MNWKSFRVILSTHDSIMCQRCWTCDKTTYCQRVIGSASHVIAPTFCNSKCRLEYSDSINQGLKAKTPSVVQEWEEMRKKARARVKRILKMGY